MWFISQIYRFEILSAENEMLCYGLYSTYIPLVGLLKSLSQMILDTSPEVTLQALDVIRSENVQVIKDNSSLLKIT